MQRELDMKMRRAEQSDIPAGNRGYEFRDGGFYQPDRPEEPFFGNLTDFSRRGYTKFPESHVMYDTRGLHSGKGPKSYRRSDERTYQVICDRLTDDPYVDASGIEVQVTDCEVVLTGTVGDRATKRRVEDLVESIPGITHVENRLRIS